MKKRKIGNLEVSTLGLGCMGYGVSYDENYNKKELIYTIHQALDLGINFFDTAEAYGPYINEEIVGEALKNKNAIIATKFGIKHENGKPILNSKPKVIKESLNGSLKRLGVECIDLYYLHRVDTNTPIEYVASTMKELIKEGKIKYWGLSEAGVNTIIKADSICKVTAIQSEYSMIYREAEKEIMPLLKKLNIGFVAFSPLGKGFLSGALDENRILNNNDFRKSIPRFNKENIIKNKEILNILKDIANNKKATMAQIALSWILHKENFIVPIFGASKIDRLKENILSVDIKLSEEELNLLEKSMQSIIIYGDRYPKEHLDIVNK